MKRHIALLILFLNLCIPSLRADDPVGAERKSIGQQEQVERIGAERSALGIEMRDGSPWFAPAAWVFYIFLIPILASYGVQGWRRWKHREEQLRASEEQQEMREQHLHFVANISHEIRTPLTLISAPLKELVAHNDLTPHDRDLLAIMQRNVTRLNHLAEQILNTSNHGKDDRVLKTTFGDISAFVEGIANNFRFYAHEKGLHLTFDTRTDGQQGYFDMEKVEKIVSNLMSNAIKYTPEGGDIVVRVSLCGTNAEVVVKDTGIGITGSRQREMFRRFNRLDMSVLNPSSKGFGVGLHYAQCLAFLHRGHLSYEPNVPQGSRFTLTIPYKESVVQDASSAYAPSDHSRLAAEASTSVSSSLSHSSELGSDVAPQPSALGTIDESLPTILLVEDDYEMRGYVQMLLSEDYNVIVAGDGEEALEKLKLNIPDLVLSDVVMRRMDGFELCQHIKASDDYGYLPVLLLTAKSDMDNRKHGIDCGADAYIGKPFDPYYLKSVVASVLENRLRIQRIIRNMTHVEETVTADAPAVGCGKSAAPQVADNPMVEPILSERDRDFLATFHKLLSDHLDDFDLNVNQLASDMNLSYSSLYARVKDLTGQSPQVFLNTYRMNIAMELLQTHNYTVSEVCYKVGASSPANFARAFKKQFGVVPSAV